MLIVGGRALPAAAEVLNTYFYCRAAIQLADVHVHTPRQDRIMVIAIVTAPIKFLRFISIGY